MPGTVYTDTIAENTPNNGVLVDGVKLIDGGMQMLEQDAPDTPAVGKLLVYPKTDKGLYVKDSNGNERKINTAFAGVNQSIFFKAKSDSAYGNYDVVTISTNGLGYFTFIIPKDFNSVVNLKLVGIASAGAALINRDIDLSSNCAAAGELYNSSSESNTTILYDLSGKTDRVVELDVSSVFTTVSAGKFCGLKVTHNSIGGSIYYLGILLEYN